jgi:hypothetical protein
MENFSRKLDRSSPCLAYNQTWRMDRLSPCLAYNQTWRMDRSSICLAYNQSTPNSAVGDLFSLQSKMEKFGHNLDRSPICLASDKIWKTWVALGEKSHFSTMFSTTFQLSFIVENITFNCKMFFTIKNWHCQLTSKKVNNVELTYNTIENNVQMSICGLMLRWQHLVENNIHFNRCNISIVKC